MTIFASLAFLVAMIRLMYLDRLRKARWKARIMAEAINPLAPAVSNKGLYFESMIWTLALMLSGMTVFMMIMVHHG